MRILVAIVTGLAATWITLIGALLWGRPRGGFLNEAVRLLPDTLRLLKDLATDGTLPRGVRVRLWLLFAYLAMPFDLVPDFIPVVGYADDAILIVIVLRSVVRRSGRDAVQRHWSGTPEGLAALWRVARMDTQSR